MLVSVNDTISPNECGATPPLDIVTIPRTTSQADSTSDMYEPLQGPSHSFNSNFSPE